MREDLRALEELNVQIGTAETAGDRDRLDALLAPRLAFRRANGVIEDRGSYLATVAASGGRETEIEAIHLHGNRAVVACIVTMRGPNGETKRFHNLRLFVREEAGWRLLGWANEPH
jgi:Domain of unknown function (DUF4440)